MTRDLQLLSLFTTFRELRFAPFRPHPWHFLLYELLVTLVNVDPDNGHKEENATGVDEKGQSAIPGIRPLILITANHF
jgi:hypothetical protein